MAWLDEELEAKSEAALASRRAASRIWSRSTPSHYSICFSICCRCSDRGGQLQAARALKSDPRKYASQAS